MQVSFRRYAAVAAAGVVLAASLAAAAEEGPRKALSPAGDRERDTSASQATLAPKAIGGASAPNARLAALVDAGGTAVRTKGVTSISHPDTGVYCIKPESSANINVSAIVPTVSVEYYYSNPKLVSGFNEMLVQWASKGSGCPSGNIGVYTFADKNLDSHFTFSNEVAFSIVVP